MSRQSEDIALRALMVPFENGNLAWPPSGEALFIGARDGWPLHQAARPGLRCIQWYRPEVDALQRSGLEVIDAQSAERYPLVMLLPPRQREQSRALLVRALDHLQPDGVLLAAQPNDAGGKSGEADLRALAGPLETLAKHHCRVYWARAPRIDQALAAEWRDIDAPRPILDGAFISRPGVFAWDRIDAASAMLAAQLPSDLAGTAADLGAGYGYLSFELLRRCAGIRGLDVVEADQRALDLARQNLARHSADRALSYHWLDVTRGLPHRYDVIVCNPPFHAQSAVERPDIGRAFVVAAAAALNPGGRLWLVANRHLPYESVLNEQFGVHRSVCQSGGFKVIEAIKHQGKTE